MELRLEPGGVEAPPGGRGAWQPHAQCWAHTDRASGVRGPPDPCSQTQWGPSTLPVLTFLTPDSGCSENWQPPRLVERPLFQQISNPPKKNTRRVSCELSRWAGGLRTEKGGAVGRGCGERCAGQVTRWHGDGAGEPGGKSRSEAPVQGRSSAPSGGCGQRPGQERPPWKFANLGLVAPLRHKKGLLVPFNRWGNRGSGKGGICLESQLMSE